MKTSKNILIIPGFGGDKNFDIYKRFQERLGENCYIFSPKWKYRTINDWVREYEDFIKAKKLTNFTVMGFSIGAYIIACSSIIPKKTIYASMSPLFKEDIPNWPKKMISPLGQRRIKNLGEYKEKPNSVFVVGENEVKFLFEMIGRISGKNRVIVINDVGHDLSHERYFDTVLELLTTE